MRKCYLIAVAFAVVFTVSGYTQDQSRRSFFFSAGLNTNRFISNDSILLLQNFWLDDINTIKIGGHMEFPVWVGKLSLGLEGGYSSGTRFGGHSGVDIIPINLSTAYRFQLINNILSVGPGLRAGTMSFLGPNWSSTLFVFGGWVEAEFQYPYFPISMYVAGGVDVFPTAYEPGMFPTVEFGLRFPRQTRPRPERSSIALLRVSRQEEPDEPEEFIQEITPDTDVYYGLINPVFFEPNNAYLMESSHLMLDAIGRELMSDSSLLLILRVYSAEFDNFENRQMLSDYRARFCKDYLIQHFNIEPHRIVSDLYGFEMIPDHVTMTSDLMYYRCVELIVY